MNAEPLPFHGAVAADREQCLEAVIAAIRRGTACVVVTAEVDCGLGALVRRCLATAPVEHTAHVAAEAAEPRAFLETLLTQFGFEPFAADERELFNLLRIFLQHENRQGRRTLLAVEHVNRFGPRILELLQELLLLPAAAGPPLSLLLSGRAELLQVLDSPGMQRVAHLTRQRWQLKQDDGPPAAGYLLLVGRGAELLGRLALDRPRILIGRQRQNDLALDSHYVSRHHALLTRGPDGLLLVDLNSTNGTYVNGVSIKQQRLAPGDIIGIGDYQLKLILADVPQRFDAPTRNGRLRAFEPGEPVAAAAARARLRPID